MRVRINGRSWQVRDADIENWGECTPSERLIELRAGQRPKDRMDTLIHELLHAIRPRFSEREVVKLAKALSEGMWADGWRRDG